MDSGFIFFFVFFSFIFFVVVGDAAVGCKRNFDFSFYLWPDFSNYLLDVNIFIRQSTTTVAENLSKDKLYFASVKEEKQNPHILHAFSHTYTLNFIFIVQCFPFDVVVVGFYTVCIRIMNINLARRYNLL